ETFFVRTHEKTLADRGARLQVAQIGWSPAEPQSAHAGTNGARAHQRYLPSRAADALDLVGQRYEPVLIERAVRAGQDVRSDLAADGVSQCDDFLANGIDHA